MIQGRAEETGEERQSGFAWDETALKGMYTSKSVVNRSETVGCCIETGKLLHYGKGRRCIFSTKEDQT